jgi:manganese/iron transport system ATP-binding protein
VIDAALTISGLSVRFGARVALESVDLVVGPGRIVGVVGPNGAGKTTLFRAILGAVEPTSGTIVRSGRPGYVPQGDEEDLSFPLTALDVVLMGGYRRQRFFRPLGRELRREAAAHLDRVGLADRARSPIGELSGGQRQRVLLARALLTGSRLLLLDEPLNGVDVATQEVIVEVLKGLRDAGGSILVSTHDLGMARALASDLLFLNRTVVAYGPSGEVFTAATLRATFSGSVLVLDAPGGALEVVDPGFHCDHDHDHRPRAAGASVTGRSRDDGSGRPRA